MRIAAICTLVAALGAGLAAIAIYAARTYGLVLFVGIPMYVGFATTALLSLGRPRTYDACAAVSSLSLLAVALAFVVTGMEGLLCLVMSAVITVPLTLLGSFVAYRFFMRSRLANPGVTTTIVTLALLIAAFVEPAVRDESSPTYVASDSIEMHATAEEAWQTIVTLGEIAPPDDLFFNAGIACPRTAKIVDGRQGGLRVCTLTTGVLVERIDAWEPNRRLGWRALSTPPPMKELNPFHDVDPPHLHGFYRNIRGEFAIERIDATRVRVIRRTWYQHDLYPSAYWRIWCDIGASKIHRLVLEKVRSETERRRGGRRA